MTYKVKLSKKAVTVIVLSLLAGLILFARLYTFNEPIERNIGVYAVGAHELLAGRSLYSDLWESRPPGNFLTYALAEMVFGYGPHTVFLLTLGLSLIILLGIHQAASQKESSAGLWAAAFWAILSGDLFLRANQPDTELFLNACLVWALALILSLDGKSLKRRRCLAVGLLLAWAAHYRVVSAMSGAALVLTHAFLPGRFGGKRKIRLQQAALMGGAGSLLWAITISWFWTTGRGTDFYEANIVYNTWFSGSFFENLTASLKFQNLVPSVFRSLSPLILASFLFAVIGLWKGGRHWVYLASLMAAAQIQLASQRYFHFSYYQIWMPLWAISVAWGAAEWRPSGKWMRNFSPAPIVCGIIVGILLIREYPFYRLPPEQWPAVKYGHRYYGEAKKLGKNLRDVLQEDETFYQWGFEPELYFYSRKRPPTGVLHVRPLIRGPLQEKLTKRVLSELKSRPPALVVASKWTFRDVPSDHPIARWIKNNYRPYPGNDLGHFVLFAEKGGDLEKRLLGESRRAHLLDISTEERRLLRIVR